MPNKICKVHFIYVVIILLLIIAFISGISFSDNDVLVDTISVTSGVVSIIIGALAIFIAIYQGLTQGTSIQKMNESADRVEATTKKLKDTNFDEMGDNIHLMKNSLSELTNDNKEVEEIQDGLGLTKDVYKTIFIHTKSEYFFSAIIEIAFNTKSSFLINHTGSLILNYKKIDKKHTQDEEQQLVIFFARYINMLRRSGALAYTNIKKDTGRWVTITFLSSAFIEAINDKKSEDDKFEEISNYIKENESLFN